MRLVIASDLHGSAPRAAQVREKISELKPDAVLLLGDLLYHGPRNPLPEGYAPAEVAAILAGLKGPVIAIRGNCDSAVDQMVLPFHLAESAWLGDGGRPILAVHGHELPENGGTLRVPEGPAILFGHIHLPVAEKRAFNHYWNPGSAALPKEGHPPSFGFYEGGRFEVRSFEGRVLAADVL
ncbi:MAG: phosphodiesterase [Candidatus Adiutrix sp.]|jgi:putative phosphoesterase|nr:phosphodiesterase [Candidatus Adiutrix sp.]